MLNSDITLQLVWNPPNVGDAGGEERFWKQSKFISGGYIQHVSSPTMVMALWHSSRLLRKNSMTVFFGDSPALDWNLHYLGQRLGT